MLETIWFVLWGLLWAIYFALDGYDLGIGMLLPFLGKDHDERRVMINAMGPFWDGNEVWLITAGGVTFAAFPGTYATMFSSLYTPLMLILFALIFRGISFEFRGKVDHPSWIKLWDTCLTIGSFIPALLFGVAFANIFAGLPLDRDGMLHGNLLTLLNPYGLVGGVLFVLLFLVHGSLMLGIMSEGSIHRRARKAMRVLWPILLGVAIYFLIATYFATPLYENYFRHPWLFVIPLAAVVGLIQIRMKADRESLWPSFAASAVTILSTTLFGVAGIYPNLLPSSLDPVASRTAFNTSSSPLTLKIMLAVALITIPAVIAYQTWVHVKFSTKTRLADLIDGESY
ncbi:MAG: cytochrome d ubiquinol oxidase subunit II [Pseudomonadota bacterium]